MIIQGSNLPIVVTFDEEVSELTKIVGSLWAGKNKLKQWDTEDILVDGHTATFPLDEDETKTFPSGTVTFEIKGVDDGQTVFWEKEKLKVLERNDRNIDMVE